jgi:prepilin-type N-terminal cleavage/methylation domain-containing protein
MGTDMHSQTDTASHRGFSLIELLVVVAIITIVMAAILTQVDQIQQRATAEQGRVDDFQQARDFMAQVVREARQMGYPNVLNFDTNVATSGTCGSVSSPITVTAWATPLMNDCRIAVGLIKLTNTELDFSGDVDGTGIVSIVSYKLNGDGSCAACMERAQVAKANAQNPLTQVNGIPASSYVQEVQNVLTTNPIFSAYKADGTAVSMVGLDITSNPAAVATARLIKINLSVANPNSVDPRTGHQLEADLSGNVQVVNCSMATSGIATAGLQVTCN